ncbi:hypothetical protein V495_01432 [Pseudogymnoascus sp. VKM F-4514 (FW-929)]|nr:hypothetical protein V495_01432 [Pseudogymnoascus sp. VKM F-4514 (FW-929)]KFY55821.1 hypothetical protein V497_06693 [Pseudogymnoascus sp. VKM F-4516 (FW-969)]
MRSSSLLFAFLSLAKWTASSPLVALQSSHEALDASLNQRSQSQGKWTSLPSLTPYKRQEHRTVALNSTHLYVLGGIIPEQDGVVFPTVTLMQAYSIPKRQWITVAPVPIAFNHPNAAVINGKIYLLGGLTPGEGLLWVSSPKSYVYDPVLDKWSALPDMPNGRGSAAVATSGTTIYLAGGLSPIVSIGPDDREDTVNITSSYNVATKKWTSLPDLPAPRDHAGVALIDNSLYILGGRAFGHDNVVDTVFAMDLGAKKLQWTTNRAKMPTPRGGLASATLNNIVYTFGGEGDYSNAAGVYNETEAYNPKTNKWTKLPIMAHPRHGTCAVTIGNKIYIAGGGDLKGGAPVDTFDYFSL